ncbi:MAG: hypothetical protein EZS28_032969 [Streblomastix strix]|uniref:Uncharacterized protein n=1 Tax=Streblomastix strix TaxID=222440 RepID=A0A5J4UMI1_9EUKA|nr:MAG: hypothetical protein EZS28_032969 [Streblomastix strix]
MSKIEQAQAKAKSKAQTRSASTTQQQSSSSSSTQDSTLRDGKKYKTDAEVLQYWKLTHPLNKTVKDPRTGKKIIVKQYKETASQTGGLTAEEQKYLNVMQYAIDPIRHEEVEDPRISTGRPATTYSYTYIPYNLNDVLNLPANHTGSMQLPQPQQIKENIKEKEKQIYSGSSDEDGLGIQTGPEIPLENFSDFQPDENLAQQQIQQAQNNLMQGKILQVANKQTVDPLKYQIGALDWGNVPLNAEYTNNPYQLKDYQYFMNQGGMPSLRQKKQVFTKGSKVNQPKERKNYIKTSKLMQSIAAQEKLKKYSKKNKK